MSVLYRLKHYGHALRLRPQPSAVILMYHRVAELASDPQLLAVSPRNFAAHLNVLRRQHVIPLRRLTAHLQSWRVVRPAIVITFDDGYTDNFTQAAPLLQASRLPATVFVATANLDTPQEFWWDELERLLLLPGKVPETLTLAVHNQPICWKLGAATVYSKQDAEKYCAWNVLSPDTPTPRHRLYRELHGLLYPLDAATREAVLDALREWAGQSPDGRVTHRTATSAQIASVGKNPLLEIGAHTVNHSVLSHLPEAAQREEIGRCKAALESLTGQPVTSFSYPYGMPSDYSQHTLDIVRQCGFSVACANFEGRVTTYADRLQLPRYIVRNWTSEAFVRQLRVWMGVQ